MLLYSVLSARNFETAVRWAVMSERFKTKIGPLCCFEWSETKYPVNRITPQNRYSIYNAVSVDPGLEVIYRC